MKTVCGLLGSGMALSIEASEGTVVGTAVGPVGFVVGTAVGSELGTTKGLELGTAVGSVLGAAVGSVLGAAVGSVLGAIVIDDNLIRLVSFNCSNRLA
jgi:phage tail tape-measure protein